LYTNPQPEIGKPHHAQLRDKSLGFFAASKDEKPQPLPPIQRTNVNLELYRSVVENDLDTALKEKYHLPVPEKKPPSPEFPVVVVGAGISGLAAAFELSKVLPKAEDLVILEGSDRYGGRLKTIHFRDGLHEEGGAMRLPGNPNKQDPWNINEAGHYLTDYYGIKFEKNVPGLKRIPFFNVSPNTRFYLHGKLYRKENSDGDPSIPPLTREVFDQHWPDWDDCEKNPETGARFSSPGDRFGYATKEPTLQLKWILDHNPQNPERAWDEWTKVYGAVSMRQYLFHPKKYIRLFEKHNLMKEYKHQPKVYPHGWSANAINSLINSSYNPLLDSSFAELGAEDIGMWWSDKADGMHKWDGGMQSLPQGFVHEYKDAKYHINLSTQIRYGFYVTDIDYTNPDCILVKGVAAHGHTQIIKASRVLLTCPVTIIKNINFTPALKQVKLDAMSNVSYSPSTKVLMQFKKRFWEAENINGGFSKSTDTLGQLHYPSEKLGVDHRGVLISYTWNRNALVFAAEKDFNSMTLRHAVQQVANLHPNQPVQELFESGYIQPWFSEPMSCGAFVYYDAYSISLLELLAEPSENTKNQSVIFYAGEGISVTHGWIQGALESALTASLLLRCSLLFPK
jgi:monoamine oxidase